MLTLLLGKFGQKCYIDTSRQKCEVLLKSRQDIIRKKGHLHTFNCDETVNLSMKLLLNKSHFDTFTSKFEVPL